MVMYRNQQDQHPRDCLMDGRRNPGRIDGANRESPGRLAHVLPMGSAKCPKRSHVDGGVNKQASRHADRHHTIVVAQGGVFGLAPLEALPRGNERRRARKRKESASGPYPNADEMPPRVDNPS